MKRRAPGTVAVMCIAMLAAPALSTPAAAQEGKVEDGADVYKKCRACHEIDPKAGMKVGPNLSDVIGRKVGSVEGYPYSDANKAAGTKGLVWTEEVLFKYLENPLAFMPGTKMAFAGLKDEQDRRDVIAYLKSVQKK
jgi:cytochrome c2